MGRNSWYQNWQFDPLTAVVTLVILPPIIYALFLIRRAVLSGTRYLIQGFLDQITPFLTKTTAASLSLRRYCRMQLSGVSKYLYVPSTTDINLDIDNIFVPLILERAGAQKAYDHRTLFEAGNRLRIIGDPGSGKSSIAKRIFRDECRRATQTPRKARFPILVELRKLTFPRTGDERKAGGELLATIRAEIKKIRAYDLEGCFDAYARTNGIILILDGLDEISTSLYRRAEAAIKGLSQELALRGDDNIVILTMRTQFHVQVRNAYIDTFPVTLSLKPFSPTDIYEFLCRWDFKPSTQTHDIVRIYTDLTDQPTLREMCANPLVLSMYVAQDQATGHPLAPDSRTDFYSKVTEELLIKRRAVQVGVAEGQAVLRQQRQRILGGVALEHLLNPDEPANLLNWEAAVGMVGSVTGLDPREAEEHLRLISKETGLITEEKEGETFRFIHLTFCEFLAGFEAVHGQADGWGRLISRHKEFCERVSPAFRSRLIEVLPFAAALMPRHMRGGAIDDLLASGDERGLALAFLETKLYDHPAWGGFIAKRTETLLRSIDHGVSSEWLREVHVFTVLCADAARAARSIPRIRGTIPLDGFFAELAERRDDTIIGLIRSYAEQDAVAAFRVAALCNIDMIEQLPEVVIASADQPAFLAILIERASSEPTRHVMWAAVLAEASLRSPAVANQLSKHLDFGWQASLEAVPRRSRWFLHKHIPRSIARAATELDPGVFPLVKLLKEITPPGRHWFIPAAVITSTFFQRIFAVTYLGSVVVFVGARSVLQFLPNDAQFPLNDALGYVPFSVWTYILALSFSIAVVSTSLTEPWLRAYRRILSTPEGRTRFSAPRIVIAPYFAARRLFSGEGVPLFPVFDRLTFGKQEFAAITRLIDAQSSARTRI
jgi:hypothetical protein